MAYLVSSILLDGQNHEASVICAGTSFLITQSDLELLDISEGDDIDEEKFEQLCEAKTRLACIKKALNHLSYGDMSAKKLGDKLCAKFDKNVVSDVIELLKKRKYLNDTELSARFAESFYSYKLWGPLRIKNDLFSRGFSKEDIEQACAFLDDIDHRENIEKIIRKKFGNDNEKIITQRQKVFAFLYRRGYAYSDITDVINSLE